MKILKIRFLILTISWFVLTSCFQTRFFQVNRINFLELPRIITLESQKALKFKATLQIYSFELTGLLIAKTDSQKCTMVSFFNEFGIKYFDAVISQKPAILYCSKQLDRKMLTNVLKHDLAILFLPSANLIRKGEFETGNRKYVYNDNFGTLKVEEYYRKNRKTELTISEEGEIEISHTKPEIRLFLKPF